MLFTSDMFPGTDLNDLNLDWLLEEMKELEQRVQTLEEKVENLGG